MDNATAPTNAVTKATTQPLAHVAMGDRGIILGSFDELNRFANAVARSGLAPKGISTPEAIAIAIQMGLEVGLTPMAALQNIAVINGRPSIWGDAQLGVVRATGELEEFAEWFEACGKKLPRNPSTYSEDTVAVCRVKRRGYDVRETGFSVADAKAANLWGKEGPWKQYPWRMLQMRARSFTLRDQFGDALKGLRSTEEVQDTPPEIGEAAKISRKTAKLFSEGAVEATVVAPKSPDEAPNQSPTLHDAASQLIAAGVAFDDFSGWLEIAGHFRGDRSAWTGYGDVPTPVYAALKVDALAKCANLYGTNKQ